MMLGGWFPLRWMAMWMTILKARWFFLSRCVISSNSSSRLWRKETNHPTCVQQTSPIKSQHQVQVVEERNKPSTLCVTNITHIASTSSPGWGGRKQTTHLVCNKHHPHSINISISSQDGERQKKKKGKKKPHPLTLHGGRQPR